jgi:hypothetical protein
MGLTEADRGFQDYLRTHGYEGADDHEPDLGVTRRPDFLIARDGAQAICEIKSFADSPVARRMRAAPNARIFSMGDDEVYGPIRRQVHEAARQMRELRDTGIPLVAVLANPLRLPLELDVPVIVHALYGNPVFTGPYNPATGAIESLTYRLGRDGELTNDHPYLSAVALLIGRTYEQDDVDRWWDENRDRLNREYATVDDRAVAAYEALRALDVRDGGYFCMYVIHTRSAADGTAPALDRSMFSGEHDRHWYVNADGTTGAADITTK